MVENASKKGGWFRNVLEFVFGFENKRGDQLDYWLLFAEAFSFSPKEFYDAIEGELSSRKFPTLEMSRQEFAQGGLLSDIRIYQRMYRERLAIYVCAAPFGTGFFFSCRTQYVPTLIRLWHIVVALVTIAIIARLFLPTLGLNFTILALVTLIFAIVGVFRNAASTALSDLDGFLLKIPVIATFYEAWFRNETFYREDTRVLYLKQIPTIVRTIAEEITAAKGVRLVKQNEIAPVLVQLHHSLRPSPPTQKL